MIVAFTLGWQMSELYKPSSWRGQDAKPEEDLPDLGRLGGKERAQLGLKQIEVGLKTLETKIKSSGLAVPTVTEAATGVSFQSEWLVQPACSDRRSGQRDEPYRAGGSAQGVSIWHVEPDVLASRLSRVTRRSSLVSASATYVAS